LCCEWLLTAPLPTLSGPIRLLQARAAHEAVRLNRYHQQGATNKSARINADAVTQIKLLVCYKTLASSARQKSACVDFTLPFHAVDKHLKHPFKACIALGKQLPRSASPSALQSSQAALQRTIRGAKALRYRRGAF